jgi:uncharacterized repeat protein (TIGR01451 family)
MITTAVVSFLLLFTAANASADALSPWWHVTADSPPLQPGQKSEIQVAVVNVGDAPAVAPVTVSDALPPGLEAVAAEGFVDVSTNGDHFGSFAPPIACSVSSARAVSCVFTGEVPPDLPYEGEGYPSSVPPYRQIQVTITVRVKQGVEEARSGEANAVEVSGGAPSTAVKQRLVVSGSPAPFGLSSYELRPEAAGGGIDTQAGSHPFQLTTSFTLNESVVEKGSVTLNEGAERRSVGAAKDVHVKLPPGLVGNPTPIPRCSLAEFLHQVGSAIQPTCSAQTVVGVANVTVGLGIGGEVGEVYFVIPMAQPVYNLEPAAGEPARFGFVVNKQVPVLLTTSVRTGGDYGITVSSINISHEIEFLSNEVTFWGVPGDASHNSSRGQGCLAREYENAFGKIGAICPEIEEEANPVPLLSMPTACTGPLQTSIEADSWQEPHNVESLASTAPLPALDGCNHLPFEPSLRVTPDGTAGSTPTGLNVDVHVNQEAVLNATSLADADVRDIAVALPAGVAINPAGGGGLEGCSEGLIGYEGVKEPPLEPGISNASFTSSLPEPLEPGSNFCATASKIGTVTIHTPLLPNPLTGAVYLADQEANPFGSLVALYLVAKDPVSGVLLKLPGEVSLCKDAGEVIAGQSCQAAGQIVTTFANTPQLPFEDAELHFFGGERAPLASPAHCGTYTSQASFTPWTGDEPVGASSSFEVKSGPNGSPCPGASLPFSPSLTAGTTSIQAGGFSPFTMTMSRADGSQDLQAVELKMPPGLSALLSSVELCPEPQASQGLCGANSLIGETTISVGVGGSPYTVTGGKVYITGPYNGSGACTVGEPGCAPFGLSIVNPAKAGPFDLADTKGNHPPCDCVLVRAKIEVNPLTTALTVTSDDSGPYKIPTSIEGVPLQIQHVNVTINRPGFMFNPTNCTKTAIGGTLSSAEGATQALSVPFQATNCASLKFAPKFSVSTSGKTSKADGASLTVKVVEPNEPRGSQANISTVKVELPKALSSRLTTLQKACTDAQFEADPAACPAASKIGYATVHTTLLPVPLTGPAIFVSHGGEAFPSLTMVLQGDGVTIELVGTTFISKSGITSTTFKKTIDDQPFSTFELVLPEGKYSALTANGNLCKQKLVIPNEFIGQNGAEIHQATKVSVTGCPRKAKKTSKKKAKHGRHRTKTKGASRKR